MDGLTKLQAEAIGFLEKALEDASVITYPTMELTMGGDGILTIESWDALRRDNAVLIEFCKTKLHEARALARLLHEATELRRHGYG